MRGIGRDATTMFDDVHAWVNYEQLLLKCYIGPLQNIATIILDSRSSQKGINQLAKSTTPNGCFKAPFLPIFATVTNKSPNKTPDNGLKLVGDIVPRFDWIQKSNELSLVFYTKPMCNAGITIRCLDDSQTKYEISIQICYTVYLYTFEFVEEVEFPPTNAKITYESGKIEVLLRKRRHQLWTNFGQLIRDKATDIAHINSIYEVICQRQITHDSHLLVLKPKQQQIRVFPIGYHISISANINGS